MKKEKVTKADLIEQIYLSNNVSKKDIRLILDQLFDIFKGSLAEDRVIELRGFGTFELRKRKGRERARNPKTGEIVSVESHCVATFRSGKELKSLVWNARDKK